MSVSHIEGLARAVADDLHVVSGTWPLTFMVVYDPMPDVKLTDLTTTKVFVRDDAERLVQIFTSRAMSEYEYDIIVSVWQKITSVKSQTASDLKYIFEQIADTFRFLGDKAKWPTNRNERLKRVENMAIFEDDDCEQFGLMKLKMTLVFQGWRS